MKGVWELRAEVYAGGLHFANIKKHSADDKERFGVAIELMAIRCVAMTAAGDPPLNDLVQAEADLCVRAAAWHDTLACLVVVKDEAYWRGKVEAYMSVATIRWEEV